MSSSFEKGAQSQHGVGVSTHEVGDSLSPCRILVYFLLGPSVFLCNVSTIKRMVAAGLHYSQINKKPKLSYSHN